MSTTPDKCPHCGAGEYPDSSPRFHTRSAGKLPWLCGTLRDTVNPVRTGRCFENELINERAAHAATKRELGAMRESRDEANERLASLNEWVGCHAGELNAAKSELAATKRELEERIVYLQDANTKATANMKEVIYQLALDGATVLKRAEAAEARVRELERWKSAAKAFWRAVMSEDDPDLMPAAMLQVSELIELEKQTLGEAMPRKEEK